MRRSLFVRGSCLLWCLLLAACQGTVEESPTRARNPSRTLARLAPEPVANAPVFAAPYCPIEQPAPWKTKEECTCSFDTCPAPPPCYQLAGCHPSYGCMYQPSPEGAWCEDGDACTHGDSCQQGACMGGWNTCQQPELTLEAGSELIELGQGQSRNLTTLLTVTHPGEGPLRILHEVSISPASGLSFTSDYPSGGYVTSGSVSFVLNQAFSSQVPGTYVVTNRAFVPDTSVSVTDSFTVRVLPAGGHPVLLPLGAVPDGLQAHTSSEITFTVGVADFQARPTQVLLHRGEPSEGPVVAEMNDSGTGGDLLAGDGVYTARVLVSAGASGALRYRATAQFPEVFGQRLSAPLDLVVSCHPTTLSGLQPASIVTDASGARLLCNEVQVSFVPGVSCQTTAEIIAQRVGGVVVGTQPGLGLHQVRLPGPCTASTAEQAAQALREDSRVRQASAIYIGSTQAVVPNDPLFASQTGLTTMRADEAWVLARGAGVIVAVVDSGADYTHPDLTGQILPGPDVINQDADPMDDAGHGTHLASLIAAHGGNGQGLAGLAWNGKVLAIKASNALGSITTTSAAAGIKSAADQGAKIINCSWGFLVDRGGGRPPIRYPELEDAIQYATAKGALVVASAGNLGNTSAFYPCANEDTLCVAATDAQDHRLSSSGYSAQVDIAAPGANVVGAWLGHGYRTDTGTSFATAQVSGSLAVLWSYFPSWTAARIRQRLLTTAQPLTDATLANRGRVDLFEAVFNGSFEDGVEGWSVAGTAGAVNALGPLAPRHRGKMGFLSSGPDAAQVETTLEQAFTIQPGVSELSLQFDYNFVTEEYPEWVGSIYNDNMRILLVGPDGVTTPLAYEEINSSVFSPVPGIDFPGGDDTVGATGWKHVQATLPVTQGPGRYSIRVRDEGDGVYDSNLLIDHIRFR